MEKPSAQVRDVSLSAAGFTGVRGELLVDVTNPNGFGVPLSGIDWQLSIGGARAITGNAELSQTIPAKGVAPIRTSLVIDARDVAAVASALGAGARDYQVNVKLHFSTPVGQIDVAVAHSGTLDGGGGLGGLLGMR